MTKRHLIQFTLAAGDIILMYFSLLATLIIRYDNFSLSPGPDTKTVFLQFSFVYLFWIFFLFILNFYEIAVIKKTSLVWKNLFIFSLLAVGSSTLYFYLNLASTVTPRTILILNVLLFSFLLFWWRYLADIIFKITSFKEKIIIAGFHSSFGEIMPEKLVQTEYEIIAFFDFGGEQYENLKKFENISKKGIVTDLNILREIIGKENADTIVMAGDIHNNKIFTEEIFSKVPLKINYLSYNNFYETIAQKVPLDNIDEIWFLENISKREDKFYEISKRIFDALLSLAGILITVIMLPFIAVAIKFDSEGPIFYSQIRVGKDGKKFTLHKFRTMEMEAEKNGPQWSSGKNDARVTRVGKFLRAGHVDEFPQFYNILKGDLSFVGPRPERPEFAVILENRIPYYKIRYLIKPGFTGWAWIKYQYSASVQEAKEKFQYDLFYIKNRSFLLDAIIILKTVYTLFR